MLAQYVFVLIIKREIKFNKLYLIFKISKENYDFKIGFIATIMSYYTDYSK